MDDQEKKDRILKDWIESAQDAIGALNNFSYALEEWRQNNKSGVRIPERTDGDFMAAIKVLSENGLDGWFDGHPLDVDKLAELVKGDSNG